MTGTEAIADGVPAFKAPRAANAVTTLWWMAGILGTLFLGITLLSTHFGILPHDGETVLSQLSRAVVGHGAFYYVIQAATALVLVLAANTAFADFPRLASFLAKDHFLPRQFVFRGDRLGFSVGIMVLGAMASVLVLGFGANVSHLIPLYAVGVFISFTLSQVSMAKRWWTRRESGWARGIVINGVGSVVTATVAAVIMGTKFTGGAWMVIVMLPLLIGLLVAIARHYAKVGKQLAIPNQEVVPFPLRASKVVVPIADVNRASLRVLRYAMGLSQDVTALHVALSPESGQRLRELWQEFGLEAKLVVVESPYRALIQPVLAYLETLSPTSEATPVTVVLSEFVPRFFWQKLLHNRLAARLKRSLLYRRNITVVDVPFHLA
jgi:hypothetical protein